MRKLLVLLLVCALMLGTASAYAEKEKPYAGTTINVIDVSYGATNAMKAYIPVFEELTGIKVNLEVIEHTSVTTKQEMELGMGSNAYDVMHICADKVTKYANAGWVEDLTPYLKDASLTGPEFAYEDMWDAARQVYVRDGAIYGIPVSTETTILYFRSDIFEELGLTPPATWDEVEACAKTITEKTDLDGIGIRSRKGAGINMYLVPSFTWGYGAAYLDEEGKPIINDPKFVAGVEKYARLLQNYGPAGYGDMTHNELYPMFAQGTLAMYYDSNHMMGNFINPEISTVIGKWDAVSVPAGPEMKAANAFSHGLCIPVASGNKGAAWEYIKWYTSLESQTKLALDAKFPGTVRKALLDLPEYQQIFGIGNYLNAVRESLTSNFPGFVMRELPDWIEIGDTIGQAVQDIVLGADAQSRLDEGKSDASGFLYPKRLFAQVAQIHFTRARGPFTAPAAPPRKDARDEEKTPHEQKISARLQADAVSGASGHGGDFSDSHGDACILQPSPI